MARDPPRALGRADRLRPRRAGAGARADRGADRVGRAGRRRDRRGAVPRRPGRERRRAPARAPAGGRDASSRSTPSRFRRVSALAEHDDADAARGAAGRGRAGCRREPSRRGAAGGSRAEPPAAEACRRSTTSCQIQAIPIGAFLLSTVSTLASIAYGKLGAGQLDEARGAIDAIRALMPGSRGPDRARAEARLRAGARRICRSPMPMLREGHRPELVIQFRPRRSHRRLTL